VEDATVVAELEESALLLETVAGPRAACINAGWTPEEYRADLRTAASPPPTLTL
jgi:hypothetical protein